MDGGGMEWVFIVCNVADGMVDVGIKVRGVYDGVDDGGCVVVGGV